VVLIAGAPLCVISDRIWKWLPLLLSVGLYAAVLYTGVNLPTWPVEGRWYFNPFAWQLLFVLGAWFGRRALQQGRAIGVHLPLVLAAAAVLVVGGWMRAVDHGLIRGPAFDFDWIMLKQDLAWPRLLHALAVAYIAVVLFHRREIALRHFPAQALAAVGRNSLQVFCVGLFLSYGAATAYRLHPDWRLWLELPLIVGGGAALHAFAVVSERRHRAGAAKPSGAEPANTI
jgi:hypothetical protein